MKFIKFSLFLLFIFTTCNLSAQIKVIDDSTRILINKSLINLKISKSIPDKIKYCLELETYYGKTFIDSAFFYSNLSYKFGKNTDDIKSIYKSSQAFGYINRYIGNHSNAVSIFLEAIDRVGRKNDSLVLFLLRDIEITYRKTKDYRSQLDYAIKIRKFGEKSKIFVAGVDATIGDAYQNLNILDSALYHFNKDYEISLTTKEYDNNIIPIVNLGEINIRLGNNEVALSYFRKAYNYLKASDDAHRIQLYAELTREMSKVFKNLYIKDSSIMYAQKSYQYAFNEDIKNEIRETSNYLAHLFSEYNLKDSSYKYQDIYVKLQDTLYNSEKIRDLQIVTINESIRQQKIQEDIEKAKVDRENNLILAAIGFFIPVFISLVFLINKRSKRKSKFLTSLGIASLLMLFEFISLLVHPYIQHYTNHNVILMYIILLIIASALVPLHHKMENIVKEKFT